METSPDISAERAHSDFIQFMSGVSPSILAFVVFGTTKALRAFMWDKFVPRCLKDRLSRKKRVIDDEIPLA